jgi:hypothetical protein
MDATLRPLTTSQVLDRTFQLYKQHFLLFVGIAAVGPGLSLLASLILLSFLGTPIIPDPKKMDPSSLLSFFARSMIDSVVGLVVLAVGTAIATGAAIHAVSMVHLGKATTIVESYRSIKSSFWRILGVVVRVFLIVLLPILGGYLAMIVVGLLGGLLFGMMGLRFWGVFAGFGLGFLVLLASIVWAVYLYCRYALAVPACVIEALPVKYALRRSKFLSQGSVLRIFVIFLLMFVLSLALTSVLQMPAFFFANPLRMQPGPVSHAYLFFAQLGQFLGKTFAGPIATIAIALVYYDERVRKEAFDLQVMMESLPSTATQAAASASPN